MKFWLNYARVQSLFNQQIPNKTYFLKLWILKFLWNSLKPCDGVSQGDWKSIGNTNLFILIGKIWESSLAKTNKTENELMESGSKSTFRRKIIWLFNVNGFSLGKQKLHLKCYQTPHQRVCLRWVLDLSKEVLHILSVTDTGSILDTHMQGWRGVKFEIVM